jgi:phosphoribosylaminoimidazole-succinocarboxamide synthase
MPKRWSTKALTVVEEPTPTRTGVGAWEFTDDYSVFHFGKMPDQVPDKGEALCRMAAHNFRLLEAAGVPTHFRRFLPPNRMEFRLVRVLDPGLNQLAPGARNCLVPLQVVYRNRLPDGASVFRRLERGTATLEQLGLARRPQVGDCLSPPMIEFTTKLEEIDRFVTHAEAQALACLSDAQFERVKQLAWKVDDVITRHAESVGLQHEDGKIELGIDDAGELMLVDVAGTTDENRFTFDGFHLSKQLMRQFYLARGLERDVQEWAAQKVPRSAWPRPERLPAHYIPLIADMYHSMCEAWTGERIWGAPPLGEMVERLRESLSEVTMA